MRVATATVVTRAETTGHFLYAWELGWIQTLHFNTGVEGSEYLGHSLDEDLYMQCKVLYMIPNTSGMLQSNKGVSFKLFPPKILSTLSI